MTSPLFLLWWSPDHLCHPMKLEESMDQQVGLLLMFHIQTTKVLMKIKCDAVFF